MTSPARFASNQPRPQAVRRAGVTLLEMMVVMTLIALIAGLTYPSINSGVDSLRLRAASDSIVALLNTSLDRASRRQQVVQILISPAENAILARSADLGFVRRLDLGDNVHIEAVLPLAEVPSGEERQFLIYPGGTVPGIGIELANKVGRKRMVSVDPITGVPRAQPQ